MDLKRRKSKRGIVNISARQPIICIPNSIKFLNVVVLLRRRIQFVGLIISKCVVWCMLLVTFNTSGKV